MLVADVSAGSTFSARTPRILFRIMNAAVDPFHRAFDVSVDGSRLLMITSKENAAGNLVLVTNWFRELRAR